jgi:hypothetical protein
MPLVFLVLIGAAFLAGRASSRGGAGAPSTVSGRSLDSGRGRGRGEQPRLPSPNAVLDEVIKLGAFPPPFLVQHALGEAQAIGDHVRCAYIVGAFIAPVVGIPGALPAGPAVQSPQAPPAPPTVESDGGAGLPAAGSSVASPLVGVSQEQWQTFAGAMEREAVDYATDRHVGRYRHDRRRLAELGVPADALPGDPVAQDQALAMDVADACQHVVDSGMGTDFVGSLLDVPSDGGDMQATTTLSGVIGVCCVAGLEGAAEWLTKPRDRRSFPHTTAGYWRSNGLF